MIIIKVLDIVHSQVSIEDIETVKPAVSYKETIWKFSPRLHRKVRQSYTKFLISTKGIFWTGLIPRIRTYLRDQDIDLEVRGKPELIKYHNQPQVKGKNLRPDQLELINTMLEKQRGVIVSPTGCLTGDTLIRINRGGKSLQIRLDDFYRRQNQLDKLNCNYNLDIPTRVRSYNGKSIQLQEIDGVVYSGKKEVWQITLENGKLIKATRDHKFLTRQGWVQVWQLRPTKDELMCDTPKAISKGEKKQKHPDNNKRDLWHHPYARTFYSKNIKKYPRGYTKSLEIHRCIYEAALNDLTLTEFLEIVRHDPERSQHLRFITRDYVIHHNDENHYNNELNNLQAMKGDEHRRLHSKQLKFNFNQGIPVFSRIKKIDHAGFEDTYDIQCSVHHNFSANDIIAHNSGKTLLTGALFSCFPQQKRLFLVDTSALLKQAVSDFIEYGLTDITTVDKSGKDLSGKIVVAMRQSLVNMNLFEISDLFDIVVIDECFHGKTKIETTTGLREIQSIKIGDFVYTEKGINRVKRTIRKKVPLNRVIKISLSNKTTIFTSKEHLFKTDNGWIEAQKLKGKHLHGIQHNVSYLRNNIQNKEERILLKEMLAFQPKISSLSEEKYQTANRIQSFSPSFNAHENKQPILRSECGSEGDRDQKKKWVIQLQNQGGQWYGANFTRSNASKCLGSRMGKRIANSIISIFTKGTETATGISNLLQSRCGKQRVENCNRNRWTDSLWETKAKGCEKGLKANGIRVESVEVYKRGNNDESFRSIIGDKEITQGFIEFYDLEIENEHNYYAEGVLVHNCHGISSSDVGFVDILDNCLAPVRIGLTATYPSAAKSYMAIEGVLGPVIGEFTEDEAVDAGIIAKTKVILREVPHDKHISYMSNYQEVYKKAVVEHVGYNRQVIKEAKYWIDKGLTVLIIFVVIEHGKLLESLAKEMGIVKYAYIDGSTDINYQEQVRKDFTEKKLDLVIASMIWKKGINVPTIGCLINALGGKSDILLRQMKGRGGRVAENKDILIYVDFFNPSHEHLIRQFGYRLCLYFQLGWCGEYSNI